MLLAELLGATVRVGTVKVGEVDGVFLDGGARRAIGLEVSGAGGVSRFLPWIAARFAQGAVSVESALFFVDDGASYERLGARLARDREALDGVCVDRDGRLAAVEDAVSSSLAAGTSG